MTDKKIASIKKKLKLPENLEIPKHNKLSHYNPYTRQRTETRVLNSCYHLAHSRKFTEFFAPSVGQTDVMNISDDEENDNDDK